MKILYNGELFESDDRPLAEHFTSNGVVINNPEEYRSLLGKLSGQFWKTASDEAISRMFTFPKKYPVVITLRVNDMDAYKSKGLHFIYLASSPSSYSYSESTY